MASTWCWCEEAELGINEAGFVICYKKMSGRGISIVGEKERRLRKAVGDGFQGLLVSVMRAGIVFVVVIKGEVPVGL